MYRRLLVLLCALPLHAHGNCANDAANVKLALSPDSLAIRNQLFSQLCAGGELYDATDPGLTGRLTDPKKPAHWRMWDALGARGNLLLAFLVDTKGEVQQVTVVVSSGDKKLDAGAVNTWRNVVYAEPAKLDGTPVRVLEYYRFKSIVNGK